MMGDLVALVTAYGIGSIPFAFLIARRIAGVDVRRTGSGNVGAANVYRTTSPALGFAVLGLDAAKGMVSVVTAQAIGLATQAASGVAAVTGHIWPLWLGSRGGKGVTTASGAFLVLAPTATILAAVVFGFVVTATRYVSLGSIAAGAALPILTYFTDTAPSVVSPAAASAVLVIARHRSNLACLHAGTERRLGQRLA